MLVNDKAVSVTGRFIKTAHLTSQYYNLIEEPENFIKELKKAGVKADLFTFAQSVTETEPRYDYHLEYDSVAVLTIDTYEHWWKKQVNDKTRNMVRKAGKKGVEIRVVDFDDDLIRGICEIYSECPIRQGKPFEHYGMDFETAKVRHCSYADRSDFIGAFFEGKLIGFIKLVHGKGYSNIMQIIAMVSYRNRAPTNALVAKAVEICAERGIPLLHYGEWSKMGLGDFKIHHAFKCHKVPRYFIPLTLKGRLALRLGLHQKFSTRLPQNVVEYLIGWRSKFNRLRYANR